MVRIKKVAAYDWKRVSRGFKYDKARNMVGYGKELVLNLYGCSLEKISQKKHLEKFIVKLCDDVIRMKRYGKPLIPNFGHGNPLTSGYSLVQFIETSSVTGHFSNLARSCYLNIFSCDHYDPERAAEFCKKYFEARRVDAFLTIRP